MKILKLIIASTLLASPRLVQNRSNNAALPTVFYIDGVNGRNSYNGTKEKPYQTIAKALETAGDLELHLMGDYKYQVASTYSSTFGKGHDNISIIGEDGAYPKFTIGNDSSGYLGTNLTLDKITYVSGLNSNLNSTTYCLYACGNDLTFGRDCKVDNETFNLAEKYESGIEYGRNFGIFAGCDGVGGKGTKSGGQYVKGPATKGQLKNNSNTLTFLSGDFGKILLSNRVADTGTDKNHFKPKVIIGGSAYVSYVGGANDWFNYIDSEITVKDDARVYRIVGGILGYKYTSGVDEKVYIYNGKSTINIEGGYVKNIIGGSMGRMSAFVKHNGNTEINVSGGYVESLIGGSAAGNTFGDIHINVTGGTFGDISDSVKFGVTDSRGDLYATNHEAGFYCGGAGTSSLIRTTKSTTEEIFSNLGGCYKENDILDQSKKVMAMGNTYGNIYANITGGTFNCNIYGGGMGVDHSKTNPEGHENDLFNVAQVSQGVTLNISGCKVTGNIYGGGFGIKDDSGNPDDYYRIAMVAGTIKLTIGNSIEAKNNKDLETDYDTIIKGTIYGGGVNPKVTSLGAKDPVIVLNIINTYVEDPDGDIAVHGGSENASVDGNILIDIKGSYINDNIYLGSGKGDINGSINIDVLDSTIIGNMTLGSSKGDIDGDVTVLIEGLSVVEDIKIGSDEGTITGKVDVTISSTSVTKDIDIRGNNDIEVVINKGTTIGGTINDDTNGSDLIISDDTQIGGETLYVESFIRAKGNYTNARLEARHIHGPAEAKVTYKWYKLKDETKTLVQSGEQNYIEHLTSEDTGTYQCVATYVNEKGETVNVFSNKALFQEKSDVQGVSVSFDSLPIFNFYVECSSDFNENSKAIIKVGDRTEEKTGVESDAYDYKTYKFSMELRPYEMADEIRIEIESEGVNTKYSVKQYCKQVLEINNGSVSDEFKSLIRAFLNFGASSQEYFDYASYNLANGYLTEEEKILSSSISEEYNKLNIDNSSTDIKAYSATVEILSSVTIRIYFVTLPQGSIDGYKAYINGEEISEENIQYKNSRYYVEITGVSVRDFDKAYTVRLEKDDQYVSVTYSVLTYCYSKQNSSNPTLKNVALSLYDYYQAVQSYLATR